MDVKDCDKSMMYAVFEDNNGAIELAKTPKMRLRTKHIAIKCHHFCSFVAKGDIKILKVDKKEKEVDWTKPILE